MWKIVLKFIRNLEEWGGKATYGQKQVYGVADEVPVMIDGQTIATLPVKEILP